MCKVEIRSVTHREGKKNDKAWAMDFVTAIVYNDDGSEALGEFILPKNHPPVQKGMYDATVRAYAADGRVAFAFNQLSPVKK